MGLFASVSVNDTEHKWDSAKQHRHYAESYYAESRISFIVMLNAIMLSDLVAIWDWHHDTRHNDIQRKDTA